LSVDVHAPNIRLGKRIALNGSAQVPLQRRRFVPGDPLPIGVKVPQVGLSGWISAVRSFLEPASCLRKVLCYTPPKFVSQPKQELGLAVPCRCALSKMADLQSTLGSRIVTPQQRDNK
jgi:hypothetical protein